MNRSEDSGLFGGTACYYARFRGEYPPLLFDYLKDKSKLHGSGCLLDLGCGTGQLAIPLAEYFEEVIGMDPDSAMLDEARSVAQRLGIANITWLRGSSYDIGPQIGSFNLVTMGKSYHWMDRTETLKALYKIINPGSGIAIIGERDWVWSPKYPWQEAIKAVVADWLGQKRRAGSSTFNVEEKFHEDFVSESKFMDIKIHAFNYSRKWDLPKIVGYLYSTSYCSTEVLGSKRVAFEADLKSRIRNFDENELIEDVTLETILAWKRA